MKTCKQDDFYAEMTGKWVRESVNILSDHSKSAPGATSIQLPATLLLTYIVLSLMEELPLKKLIQL